ncbi:MAG TPA: DUF4197 domain-containing protein [Terriglobia bacterium]|nr:DUF4197 domain-containing protein [Terriglobia bacterium]
MLKARLHKSHVAVFVLLLCLLSTEALPQINISDLLKKIPTGGVSEKEASQGIKEALTQGLTRAVLNLNRTDGFFGNELYKVLLPPDAKRAESALRRIGLGGQVDKAVLAINRGAEDAVGSATPIFTNAIRQMTVTDALGIVKGNKDAATQYFRRKTSSELIAAFTPPVKTSLDKTHATRYYADIANTYNRLPTSFDKVNPDLTSYVVTKAVDALFDLIAKEEANIRANPVARTTDILKKVFGASRAQ